MPTQSNGSSQADGATGPAASPTLRRWELATRLRELRLEAEKSVDDVAAVLMCSAAKISRMETAGRGVQPRDIRDLARFYGLPASVRDELMTLASEAKKPGWWQEYRTLTDQVRHLIGLEQSATEVRTVDALIIPGLLQTEDYTAALLEGIRPPGELSEEQSREWPEVRQRRQRRLKDETFHFWSVIDEAALVRGIGSPTTMATQLRTLLDMTQLPSVTLQIVPFSRGSYPALEGSFQWMHFGAEQMRDVVFVEGLTGLVVIEKEPEVARHRQIHEYIAESVALSPERTQSWLADRLRAVG